MSKPLWSDQNIIAAAKINRSESDVVHMMFGMRDDLQQRIAEISEKLDWVDIQLQLRDEKLEYLEAENERLRDELKAAFTANRKLLVQRSEADSDNERLRSMLPSAATRQALRRAMVDAGWSHSDNAHVWAWLERLERP